MVLLVKAFQGKSYSKHKFCPDPVGREHSSQPLPWKEDCNEKGESDSIPALAMTQDDVVYSMLRTVMEVQCSNFLHNLAAILNRTSFPNIPRDEVLFWAEVAQMTRENERLGQTSYAELKSGSIKTRNLI